MLGAVDAEGCSQGGGVAAIHTLSPAHFAQIHAILQEGARQELRATPPGRVQGDSSHPTTWLWVCSTLIPAPKLMWGPSALSSCFGWCKLHPGLQKHLHVGPDE